MLALARLSIKFFYNGAYFIYGGLLVALIGVEVFGKIHMGAQRWLDLGFAQFQPSEIMRIGVVLALARYYQGVYPEKISRVSFLIIPVLIIMAPAVLVLRQPDLGTTILLALTGLSVLFLAGVSLKYFLAGLAILAASFPVVWARLQLYQKDRILTFFDPERDPLGSGYHIIQSKIGIGSGGFSGKGFGDGTQSRLNFLPEKHTDFIFTMFAEEMGFIGSLGLIGLYIALLIAIFLVAREVKTQFSRLLVSGLAVSLFLYLFINLAMVMGLAPVVGVPLPFVSYGGTSLMTFIISLGIILCADRNANVEVGK
jgi:rod shape determining protein RodA